MSVVNSANINEPACMKKQCACACVCVCVLGSVGGCMFAAQTNPELHPLIDRRHVDISSPRNSPPTGQVYFISRKTFIR